MEDDIMEFEVCLEELWDCIITHNSSKDVARHGSSGVAVAPMVYRGNHCLLKVVEILDGTIYCHSQGFITRPAFTDGLYVFNIRCRRIDKTRALSVKARSSAIYAVSFG